MSTPFDDPHILALLFLFGNALYDLKYRRIHLLFTAAFTVLGLLLPLTGRETAASTAGAFPGLLFLAMSLSGGGAVGFGDGITLLVLSLFLKRSLCWTGLVLGLWASAAAAAILFLKHRQRKLRFPFVPFLFLGVLAALILLKASPVI